MKLNSRPAPRGLKTPEAAAYIGFSEGFLRKARRLETEVAGPRYRRIGNRVIYTLDDLDSWLDQFSVES